MADEYVDYSCSTPIERLTRDIETVLRSWHISQTDRHVSHHVTSRNRIHSTNKISEVPTFITIENDDKTKPLIVDGSIKLIRSSKVTLDMTTIGSSILKHSVNVELDLALWDGPPSRIESHVDQLPLSLSSNRRGSFPDGSILSNLSSLFGIGQHLSLSPSSNTILESILKDTMKSMRIMSQRSAPASSHTENLEHHLQIYSSAYCSLSNQLQTALNVAVSNCECRIPAFGIWGDYYQSVLHSDYIKNTKRVTENFFTLGATEIPSWMNSCDFCDIQTYHPFSGPTIMKEAKNENYDDLYFDDNLQIPPSPIRALDVISKFSLGSFGNHLYVSQLLSGTCNPGPSFFSTGAKFSIHVIPPGISIPLCYTSLESYGRLLLHHCAKKGKSKLVRHKKMKRISDEKNHIQITDVRYKYIWNKSFQKGLDLIRHQEKLLLPQSNRDFLFYWNQLNIYSFDLSWRSSCNVSFQDTDYLIYSYRKKCQEYALKLLFRAFCTSKPERSRARIAASKELEPLWGPFSDPISLISVTTTWVDFKRCDDDTPISNYGSSRQKLRVILPFTGSDTSVESKVTVRESENDFLTNIFDPLSIDPLNFKVNLFFDDSVGCATLSSTNRCIVASLIRVAALGNSCLLGHLSKASVLETLHKREELENITNSIMQQASVSQVTRNLVEVIDYHSMAQMLDDIPDDQIDNIIEEIFKVPDYPSPPQDIFRIDWPGENCSSLGIESLPKSCQPGRFLSMLCTCMASMQAPSCMSSMWMAFVAKLRLRWDHRESIPNLDVIPGIDGVDITKEKYSIRLTSTPILHAAYVNSSAIEPSLDDCIINQKLMTFNIGVQSMIYEEMRTLELSTKEEDHFFDAVDDNCEFPEPSAQAHGTEQNLVTSSGARCPIEGKRLSASKDQMYAPYLQRDEPLTEDIILERRKMLASEDKKNKYSVQSRIEAAQRLQKRKLISDMSAFKAANPGAIFQDFTNWYGNPDNPLDKYEADHSTCNDSIDHSHNGKSAEVEASEAMIILSSTRRFWSDCWDESKPSAAKDQPQLFDAFSTVEMILHWLEAIHPAVLINQVLAANLANACFILQSTVPSPTLPLIQKMLQNLTAMTKRALILLKTIKTCEDVCSLMADVEMIMSRAASLLTKFDGDAELVQKILLAPEGKSVEVHNLSSRKRILKEIMLQKERICKISNNEHSSEIPSPSVSQYILRNVDENDPCQLVVCFGGNISLEDECSSDSSSNRGGLVVALKKCER